MANGDDDAERAGRRVSPTTDLHGERVAIDALIMRFTRWLAVVGGALLLTAIGITLVSVTGRYALSAPVPGDYEIVEIACAVGIFLFFPYTHATSGNITVEFFTTGMTDRRRRILDVFHDLIFALVAALIAWRLGLGFVEKFATGESTMLIRIPFWWAYGIAVAAMALLSVVCVARIVAHVHWLSGSGARLR